ncbi:MAG: DUF1080 domain-containing protein [Blastocatellia bacterium]|nr:DUF1080 domain-containing protein [Blastocatellia bacterium]
MRTSFLLLFITLFTVSALAQKPNELTKAEKKAGWKLLFDGKTLNGWRGFHQDSVPGDWTVEDGSITKVKADGGKRPSGGDIITVEQFDNFEFSFEWKLNKGGNSGVKYLVSESLPPTGKSGVSFEYQVLDDDNHPDAKMGIAGNRKAGSLYDLIPAPSNKIIKPVGEFNQSKVIVKGNHIEHWLNGVKMLEFERGSEKFKQLIAQSKFKNNKGFGEIAKGHVLLQDHGDQIWYRNLKIRELK